MPHLFAVNKTTAAGAGSLWILRRERVMSLRPVLARGECPIAVTKPRDQGNYIKERI